MFGWWSDSIVFDTSCNNPWLMSIELDLWLQFLEVVVLLLTLRAGFLSAKATADANELKLLPFLTIFIRREGREKTFRIRNMGEGVAYDIKIKPWFFIVKDIRKIWRLELFLSGTNVLDSKRDEQDLDSRTYANGKEVDLGELLLAHLDPVNKSPLGYFRFTIVFKDIRGRPYYTVIETNSGGVNIFIPSVRLRFYDKIALIMMDFVSYLHRRWCSFKWDMFQNLTLL